MGFMDCGSEVAGSVYHPRQPQQTPFYQLVQRFYPRFEAVYAERYQERYGFWRPIIGTVVRKFLECGDLKQGFARVRCPTCREEFLVIHALVTEGVFLPETGAFLPLPKLATEPFLKLWEQEVFALLLAEGKITEEVVQNIRSWKHSGFSVDQSVRLEAGDQEGVQRLIQYFLRCPFSQARMIEVTQAGKVIYKTEHNAVGRFPQPGDEELAAGPSRNFQVFDPLDFLAEVTQERGPPQAPKPAVS